MKNENIKLLFVGDIFIDEKDLFILDRPLKDLINSHEIVSCNFEGPLKTKGSKPILKAGPNIHQKKTACEEVLKNGFNVINLSNNHIMDYGLDALKETLSKFGEDKCVGAGNDFSETYSLLIKNINGIRLGFLSFSEWGFGVAEENGVGGFAWINHPKTDEIIKESKKKVDFLVVQCHVGEEDMPLPQPEWRKRYREIISLGADIIVGHHPHVPQGIEKYKGKFIVYSLGNFYFKKINDHKNYILSLSVSKENSKIKIYPILQKENLIYLIKDDAFVKKQFELDNLSWEEYGKRFSPMAYMLWRKSYRRFVMERRFIDYLKDLIKKILGKDSPSELGWFHLFKRESHYYTIKKGLEIECNKLKLNN